MSVCISDKKNQITDLHLEALASLISQTAVITDPAELAINRMDIEAHPTTIMASDRSNTGPDPAAAIAKSHVFDRAADVTVFGGTPGLLQYRAEIGPNESTGSVLRAAGMYTAGDGIGGVPLLVCRQTFAPVIKTDGLGVRFEWDLQYSIQ
jgi:hypothetical protein